MLTYAVVIPAFNEADFLQKMLQSLANQSVLPMQAILVDDHSTDNTFAIASVFAEKHPWLTVIKNISEPKHLPGSKVVRAFQKGYQALNPGWEIIVKLDADLILPPTYFERIIEIFAQNNQCGMAGGFASVQINGQWVNENLTDDDHIRGAFKSYSKSCFEVIGGLKPAMGWDTLDEMLARYNGFQIITVAGLLVQHQKATASAYHYSARYKQGEAFYALGYGFLLTAIASFKLAMAKKRPQFFVHYMLGFFRGLRGKTAKLVTPEEQRFIRAHRWKKIYAKLQSAAGLLRSS